jgi:hypothetical protein
MDSRRIAPFLSAALAFAVVFGQITDKTTGQPLAGVEVLALRAGVHAPVAYTDANGNYRLRNVPPGRYRISISSSDVPNEIFPLTIGAHETSHRLDLVACSITLDYSCGNGM